MNTEGNEFKREEGVYTAIQQPAPMVREGNMATNWREWKMSFDYYLIAAGKESATSREKTALFMHAIGRYGREIYEELDIEEAKKSDYEYLCKKFSDYCDPSKNVNYERHIFFETYQNDENFDKFLGTLKLKSKNCEFGSLKNSLILTQLIRGIKDVHIREKLLAKSKLSLEDAVQWCRAAERATEQAAACTSKLSSDVEQVWYKSRAVSYYGGHRGGQRAVRGNRGAGGAGFRTTREQPQRYSGGDGTGRNARYTGSSVCDKCGKIHRMSDRCPSYVVKCYRCDKIGHYAKCCKNKFSYEISNEEDVRSCEEDIGELILENVYVNSLESIGQPWYEYIFVNGIKIKFKLDSGADVSVISLDLFNRTKFNINSLKQSRLILKETSKTHLPVVGYFTASLKCGSLSCQENLYVLATNCNNLLSLRACTKLNLISRTNHISLDNVQLDESIFTGIGCLPTVCKLEINENVPPVISATRKIPIKLRPRVQEELERMEKLNIIVKEDGPTDWVSSIVIVEKPDKLRICLDPKNLNRAIKRSQFLLPTLDEIASELSEAKYFSKCDANKGFWMQRLDEASSKLCTFSTFCGKFRFLRLPFGICCAPEIFHNEMYKIFKMEGVAIYIDDILIWGKNRAEHDNRLQEVLRRAKENGVKFNKEKCIFGVEEVSFLGHIFSKNGMQIDKKRIQAVVDIPNPTDKKELERFLGVTNYLSRFIPNYSEISSCLRDLLKKDVEFDWSNVQEEAFKKLKEKISTAPVLRYYSPNEPVVVSVDASSRGLGACLLQADRPVAYAARALTPAETRWVQIEKEMLAVVFGCTRFHQYIYGHCKVTVESDHKPLESIFKKRLNETPARLQRMLLRLQHYSVELKYKPGKLLYIADTLSRATNSRVEQDSDSEIFEEVMIHANTSYENVEASSQMLNRIREETEKDSILVKVCDYYFKGWPDVKRDTKSIVKPYWNVYTELHVINGILFKGDRIVIPETLRKEMLARVHEGHLGVDKCQRRAREVMWWPGMSAAIERLVLSCETCQRHRAANPREPLQPHALPDLPWEVVGSDIFELKGETYLLVVDYYSKFIEVAKLSNMQSISVILILKEIFSRFGIPKKLVTDNGTQYTSHQFKEFSKSWEFDHVTSSPLYARSNGLCERNVRTVKALMTKCFESGEDWHLALLNFRNTPVTGENYSPAQLLMSRRLNSKLPSTNQSLQPSTIKSDDLKGTRLNKLKNTKAIYNRGTRTLQPLHPNEEVRMRNKNVWLKAKVIRPAQGNRSYWLQTDNGSTYRRNRQHILKLPNSESSLSNKKSSLKYLDWDHLDESPPNSLSRGNEPVSLPGHKTTRSGRVVKPPERFVYQ